MLPTQVQRRLQGSLLSTRHTSEKFCSASYAEWYYTVFSLLLINMGRFLPILHSYLQQGHYNLTVMPNQWRLSYPHATGSDWVISFWDSLCTSTKKWVSSHSIKWKEKIFPRSIVNGSIAPFDKRFKHSFQENGQSSHGGTVHQLLYYSHSWLHAQWHSSGLGWSSCIPRLIVNRVLWFSLCRHM